MKPLLIFCTLLILSSCFNKSARVESSVSEKPATMTFSFYNYDQVATDLVGKLSVEQFWGPPNYGEDTVADKKEFEYVLTLDSPIQILAPLSPGSDSLHVEQANVTQLQLVSGEGLKKYFDKKIKLTGVLSRPVTGHHHLNALIEPEKIEEYK